MQQQPESSWGKVFGFVVVVVAVYGFVRQKPALSVMSATPASESRALPQVKTPAPPIAPPSQKRTFRSYPCTQDCSGHEAGYQWAEEHGIEDPDDCGGNSRSFIEGCRAWAEEQADDEE